MLGLSTLLEEPHVHTDFVDVRHDVPSTRTERFQDFDTNVEVCAHLMVMVRWTDVHLYDVIVSFTLNPLP